VLAQEAADQKPSYDFQDVFLAFVLLGFLILVGRLIRQSIPLLQALFLPSSIVAGVVALLLGPSALGAIASSVAGKEFFLANGIFPPEVQAVWSAVPASLSTSSLPQFSWESLSPVRERFGGLLPSSCLRSDHRLGAICGWTVTRHNCTNANF
jgi:hypothetical protein